MASKLVLVQDNVIPKTHQLSPHRLSVLGELTPARFNGAVTTAFNNTSNTGRSNILYSGRILAGGRVKLVAKLFQVKRDKVGLRKYKMFSTFHHPDGERLRVKAKLPVSFLERSPVAYPSRPPISPEFNSKLRARVVG